MATTIDEENLPRCHFDPQRGDLMITRRQIHHWCWTNPHITSALPPSFVLFGQHLEASKVPASEAEARLREVAIRAEQVVGDFIWDLAREFGYDPLRRHPNDLGEMMYAQLDMEAAREMDVIDDRDANMHALREVTRDGVAMLALALATRDMLAMSLDHLVSGCALSNVSTDVLREELTEIIDRNAANIASSRGSGR